MTKREQELRDALGPFAAFARAFSAKPIRGLHDEVYAIHAGEHRGVLRLSDCQRAAQLLGTIEAVPDAGHDCVEADQRAERAEARVRILTEALGLVREALKNQEDGEDGGLALVEKVLPEGGRLFRCMARESSAEPTDCDWPHCGCDPSANRVLDQLGEEGATIVKDEFLAEVGAFLFDVQAAPTITTDLDARAEALAEQLKHYGPAE